MPVAVRCPRAGHGYQDRWNTWTSADMPSRYICPTESVTRGTPVSTCPHSLAPTCRPSASRCTPAPTAADGQAGRFLIREAVWGDRARGQPLSPDAGASRDCDPVAAPTSAPRYRPPCSTRRPWPPPTRCPPRCGPSMSSHARCPPGGCWPRCSPPCSAPVTRCTPPLLDEVRAQPGLDPTELGGQEPTAEPWSQLPRKNARSAHHRFACTTCSV